MIQTSQTSYSVCSLIPTVCVSVTTLFCIHKFQYSKNEVSYKPPIKD